MADKTPNYKNTEKLKVHANYFTGGSTVDYKLGIPNSFFASEALDFRTYPSQMSVLPGMTNIGQGNVTDLILAMDQDVDGVRWAVGDQGNLYQIDTSNNISLKATLPENGGAGLYYNQITDQLYITGQTAVSMYGRTTVVDATDPIYRPDNFAQSASYAAGCVALYDPLDTYFDGVLRNNAQDVGGAGSITDPNQISSTTATATYDVPTTLTEDSTTFCRFAPDIEPGYSVAVYVATVGTGNWTLTLHDSLNNSLASVTIANADMVPGWNEFKFGKQVRVIVQVAQTGGSALYHFHLTSSAGDGKVSVVPTTGGTGGTGDMESVNFLWFAYRLVQTRNTWHPTTFVQPYLFIGNERYLSTYDFSNDSGPTNTQWNRHALIFKTGYEVCGLTTNNQYVVIALERRSADATRNAQDGQLVFWDQSTQLPNFIIDIPMGSPYGLQTFNNVTYFIVAGSLFAWSGGQTVIKVRKLAYQNTDYLGVTDSTIVNPNAMTIRYNLLEIAYPSSTTNVNLSYGIYSWGSVEVMYPNSLGYSYALSSGQQNTSTSTLLQTGACYNFVDSMYTSWQYTDANGVIHHGLDLLNNSSTPAPNFSWTSLIWDGGVTYKTKQLLRIQITFAPLPSGYTITPWYTPDRGTQVNGPAFSTPGATKLVWEIDQERFHELQWGFTGMSGSATTPVIFIGVTAEIEPLTEESDVQAAAWEVD